MEKSLETESTASHTDNARTYYNKPQEYSLNERNESKILYMRNFNNWIKSTLINEYLQCIRAQQPDRSNKIHIFDMGCGKGGDQLKWHVGNVKSVTFADLAENSVKICEERYNERRQKFKYEATFFPLDCTKELVGDKLETKEPVFDLVSTQFVLHYSFETLESADRFLRNAAEFLRVGGYFIGTTVNSCALVNRCRESPDQQISNDIFTVKFDSSVDIREKESIPLFGAKYHFSLDQVVDCPEYLVYFPLLEKLAEKHGLEKVARQTFQEYFNNNKSATIGHDLLKKMTALEYYELPASNTDNQRRSPIDHSRYVHAQTYLNDANREHWSSVRACRTLSKQEWEMTSLYIIFAFKKKHNVKYDNVDNIKSCKI